MAYYNSAETQKRLEAIRKILVEKIWMRHWCTLMNSMWPTAGI